MRNENMQENFLLSLKEVMRIAGENRNVISSGELEQVFAGQGLTPQQMDAVRAYMADNGIGIDEQVSLEQRISQEEHNYLEEYQALVESIELPSDGVMDAVRLSAMAGEKGAQNDLITYSLLSRGMKKQNAPQAAPEPAAPAEPEALPENTTEE